MGYAGMVSTQFAELAAAFAPWRNHGQTEKYVSTSLAGTAVDEFTGRDSACEGSPFAQYRQRARAGKSHAAKNTGAGRRCRTSDAADRCRGIRACLPPVHHSVEKRDRFASALSERKSGRCDIIRCRCTSAIYAPLDTGLAIPHSRPREK